MVKPNDLRKLAPSPTKQENFSSQNVSSGIPIPKPARIREFSDDQWEEFTEEWATSLEDGYFKVARHAGAGDEGLDVVCFVKDDTYTGGWDNYQCKHYNSPLAPSDIWVEIGKIIYYSFKKNYPVPRKYYFVASKGIGTKLGKYLADPKLFKKECKNNWGKYCENNISVNFSAKLVGDFLDYFDLFDFSIFSYKSLVDLISGHEKTAFHAVRFGGGLPSRPVVKSPPKKFTTSESRYIEQIFEAYSDYTGEKINTAKSFKKNSRLKTHFLRQREIFYHAESLRNFSRDTVPPGTFESLQEEIFQGVIDTSDSEYKDGLARMKATVSQSAKLPIHSNPLNSVTLVQDKQGICHQLANEDRLIWVPSDE